MRGERGGGDGERGIWEESGEGSGDRERNEVIKRVLKGWYWRRERWRVPRRRKAGVRGDEYIKGENAN